MLKRLTIAVAAVVLAAPAFAQSPASVPRTADGKPDFSGIWQTGGISLTGGPQGNVVPAAPAPAPPPGGAAAPAGRGAAPKPTGEYADLPTQPSLQPWAAQKVKGLTAKDDPTVRCFLPGVPRVVGMPMPFEILQTPKKMAILYEAFRAYRLISLDGSKPIGERLPSYMGDSVGRWEGDTLIVEVTNFNGQIWGPGNMRVTSEAYKVTERYTHRGDTVAYEAKIEDPKVLTGPFVYRATFRRPSDTSDAEYECLEGNDDVPHLVGQ
jgi:hypothetical protein